MYPRPDSVEHSVKDGRSEAGLAGLMALVVVLILMVCTAAALLLALPETFEGAAAAAPAPRQVGSGTPTEPTFHERYPSDAVTDSALAPTF